MDDLISRRAAIDTIQRHREVVLDVYEYDKSVSGVYALAYSHIIDVIKRLPPTQPDIKQAAKLLSDFIESCPGGDSYLITPDGEELRTDWGYATEGIRLIHDWAERRTDEQTTE